MRLVFVVFFVAVVAAVSNPVDGLGTKGGRIKASLRIKVVEAGDDVVTGVLVRVHFRQVDDSSDSFVGESDTNGLFSAQGRPCWGDVSYSTEKDRYYRTEGEYHFLNTHIRDDLWEPWNPVVTVVVKRVINPIPMHAKSVNLGMPAFDVPVGFDLQVGDWVAPYGKGSIPDFVFTANLDKKSDQEYNYKLTVGFSNPGDGIQVFEAPYNSGSLLKSPHEAPAYGYEQQWVQTRVRDPEKGEVGNRDRNRNYFFRVRTVLDENGNVKSALYGKIYGDFLQFTYYLNPTPNDRNLEFDPKKNLLKGIESFESPSAP